MIKKTILFISIFLLLINNVYAKEKITLKKCIDGDTFKAIVNNKEYTIRMLSIDTPEINPEVEYYGTEARDYTCKRLTKSKKIELEYDPKSDKFDKYDRLLAWVFIDNKLLQSELIEKGYAKVAYMYDDYKYNDLLKEKQEIASSKNIGIWNNNKEKKENNEDEHKTIEAIIVTILLLIITFIYKLIHPQKRHK